MAFQMAIDNIPSDIKNSKSGNPEAETPTEVVWVFAACLESGLSTSIHVTERDAYIRLVETWFPNSGNSNSRDSVKRGQALSSLERGSNACKAWFDDHQLDVEAKGDFSIEAHRFPDIMC